MKKRHFIFADLLLSCYGEIKTLLGWSRDPRCKVSRNTLRSRMIQRAWGDLHLAMTLPPTPANNRYNLAGTAPIHRCKNLVRNSRHHRETGQIPAVLVGRDTCPRCLTMASLYSGGPHFRLCLECILGRD